MHTEHTALITSTKNPKITAPVLMNNCLNHYPETTGAKSLKTMKNSCFSAPSSGKRLLTEESVFYHSQEIDAKKYCGMIMLDLQKAFDTVDHSVLLFKLKAIGFSGSAVNWVSSYLSGRSQMVDVNGTYSSAKEITCGVPQGSVLGPLFFLIYINDMKQACSSDLFLYADDSAILVSHKDLAVVERTLSEELSNVGTWLSDNKLSLHLGKTEAILFGSKRLDKKIEMKVRVGETIIPNNDAVVYLGCILDKHLTGEAMAKKAHTKICQKTKFLARKAELLDKETLKMLAGALVQSHFDYAATSWFSGAPQDLKNKLQTAQNKLMRVVLKLPPCIHLGPAFFRQLNWLPVNKRVRHMKLGLTHKIVQNKGPKYLSNYFNRFSDRHNYATRRGSTDFILPKFSTVMGTNTFLFTAASEWNKLPVALKSLEEEGSFRRATKNWLASEMAE